MSKMKILDLVQGSDEWLKARLQYLCASEAPAMMGCSKFMSRNQLLDLKKGWQNNPDSSFKQKLFQKGHESEAAARDILEVETCGNYPPFVGLRVVDGLELLASFDGIEDGEPGNQSWEHKEWNQVLSANVRNGVLEDLHFWQLEHQCIVNGCDTVLFCCSDGGSVNKATMIFNSTEARRRNLIAGWKQFVIDLETHEIKAKQEAVVANESEAFPLVAYQVEGSAISSNLANILKIVKARAEVEMNRTLETDQDFADKENFNKSVKAARAQLKERTDAALGEFVSLSEYKTVAEQLDSVLQKMQADGEKQVKDEKAKRKGFIVSDAEWQMSEYCTACNEKIKPLALANICSLGSYDFGGAMKGLRSIEKMKSAVDTLVANGKIEIDQVMARIVPNQIYMREHGSEFKFLFADVVQIINQDTEPFQAIVKSRIADHEEAEAEKAEALRESIRKEEEQKASDKLKREQEEKEASEKLKREQEKAEQLKKDQGEEEIIPTPAEKPNRLGSLESGTQAFKPIIIDDPVREENPSAIKTTEEKAPLTFAEDMADWAAKFGIKPDAAKALDFILRKHTA